MTGASSSADAGERIALSDRLLVEWVATAKPGDPFPEPWSHSHAPLRSIVRQLVGLGIIAQPAADASVAEIARVSTAAAKLWLDAHPPQQRPGEWRDIIGRPGRPANGGPASGRST
ncbi:MAG TPA: hypothetical protein VHZ75_09875 [Solirubrobacteraceae bacterium]|jgi:hypothetical protein|nr:hypothetical protein [Solirubrobacteraceae bacterium]